MVTAVLAPGPALLFVVVNGVPSNGSWVMIGSGVLGVQTPTAVQALPASQGGDGGRVNTGDLAVTQTPITPSATSATSTGAGGATSAAGGTAAATGTTRASGASSVRVDSFFLQASLIVSVAFASIILL